MDKILNAALTAWVVGNCLGVPIIAGICVIYSLIRGK